MHLHRNIDSRILCLWGKMRWTLMDRAEEKIRFTFGPIRTTSRHRLALAYARIPAHQAHGFSVLPSRIFSFALFINFESLSPSAYGTAKLSSAAHDFKPV